MGRGVDFVTPSPDAVTPKETENSPTCDQCDHIFGLLRVFRKYDIDMEGVFPTHDGRSFMFLCNDFFYWGCADGEVYEPGDLPLLESCAADLQAAGGCNEVYTPLLFCARKRGMRPQRPYFRTYDRENGTYVGDGLTPAARALFDACGPEGSDINRG